MMTDSGMISINAGYAGWGGQFRILTNGESRFYISNNGEHTISMPSAGYALSVSGTIRSQGGEVNTGYGIRVLNSTADGGGALTANPGISGGIYLTGDAGPIEFKTNAFTPMTINANGTITVNGVTTFVGAATVTPLSVVNGAIGMFLGGGDGNTFIALGSNNDRDLYIYNNAQQRLRIGGVAAPYTAVNADQSDEWPEIGFRDVPRIDATSGWIVQPVHRGKAIGMTTDGGIVLVDGSTGMTGGDVVTIVNFTSVPMTIQEQNGAMLRLAGSPLTGTRTLAGLGVATLWWANGNEVFASGAGLT
jgi:hypothetical protein